MIVVIVVIGVCGKIFITLYVYKYRSFTYCQLDFRGKTYKLSEDINDKLSQSQKEWT